MPIIYTYGTLRPGKDVIVHVPARLYTLGMFPGLKFSEVADDSSLVVCEPVFVTDNDISRIDAYEGYNEQDKERSLYIRRPYLDGFIYEFNHEVFPEDFIPSGDWLRFTDSKKGRAHDYFG